MRWLVRLVGLFNFVVWMREFIIRPDREVWVEQMGSFVSLHSLYLGGIMVGAMLMLAGSWPVVRWIWEVPKRQEERKKQALAQRQQEEQKKRKATVERQADVIEMATNLIGMIDSIFSSGMLSTDASTKTRMLILKRRLIREGVVPESFESEYEDEWRIRLNGVLPYIIQHGVEHGVTQYDQESEGVTNGT